MSLCQPISCCKFPSISSPSWMGASLHVRNTPSYPSEVFWMWRYNLVRVTDSSHWHAWNVPILRFTPSSWLFHNDEIIFVFLTPLVWWECGDILSMNAIKIYFWVVTQPPFQTTLPDSFFFALHSTSNSSLRTSLSPASDTDQFTITRRRYISARPRNPVGALLACLNDT